MLSDAYAADKFFENMLTKEEIAQNQQFLLVSSRVQLFSIIVISFKGSSHKFSGMFSNSSAADSWYEGKCSAVCYSINSYIVK